MRQSVLWLEGMAEVAAHSGQPENRDGKGPGTRHPSEDTQWPASFSQVSHPSASQVLPPDLESLCPGHLWLIVLTCQWPSLQHIAHNYFPQNCVFTSLGRKLGKVGSLPHLLLLILPQEQKHKVVSIVWHHHHCQSIMIHNQVSPTRAGRKSLWGFTVPSWGGMVCSGEWWLLLELKLLRAFTQTK